MIYVMTGKKSSDIMNMDSTAFPCDSQLVNSP